MGCVIAGNNKVIPSIVQLRQGKHSLVFVATQDQKETTVRDSNMPEIIHPLNQNSGDCCQDNHQSLTSSRLPKRHPQK